jgi:hypothetical protein
MTRAATRRLRQRLQLAESGGGPPPAESLTATHSQPRLPLTTGELEQVIARRRLAVAIASLLFEREFSRIQAGQVGREDIAG